MQVFRFLKPDMDSVCPLYVGNLTISVSVCHVSNMDMILMVKRPCFIDHSSGYNYFYVAFVIAAAAAAAAAAKRRN